MTSQSGGGGGIKGVTSDGLMPGGEIIAGALTAGDPNAASVPSFHKLYGNVSVQEVLGNPADDDDTFDVYQTAALSADSFGVGLYVVRNGELNGHTYMEPLTNFFDAKTSTAILAKFNNISGTQFQVDGDGVQVHGKFKTGAAVAHVLGAFSGNAVPIYDEAGTLLGYMPLYA